MNAAKYNAQHPEEQPDPIYINADPPLRYSIKHHQNKNQISANAGLVTNDEDIEAGDVVFCQDNIIQPSSFMASTNNNCFDEDDKFTYL